MGALAAQHLHHPIQNQFDCRKIATGGAVPVKVMNKRTTAYHEAGHAVIARVLTLPCGPATIWPAPGSEDTEFGVFDGAGGGSWRDDGSSHASSSLRRCG